MLFIQINVYKIKLGEINMDKVIEFLQELNPASVALRLLLCVLIGGVLGIERGKQGRAAGMRTHILVCIGAALVAMIGVYVTNQSGTGDPMRIAAQVVSGIGFLGVGTILIKGRFQITGLTTAAGLWATAAIGLALGAGFYEGAILTFVFIVITITVLHRLEYKITKRYNRFGIYLEITSCDYVREAIDTLSSLYSISDIQVTPSRSGMHDHVGIEANIHIHGKKRITPGEVAHTLEAFDYVVFSIESI